MTDTGLTTQGAFQVGRAQGTPTGLAVPADTGVEEWLDMGVILYDRYNGIQWAIGDWLNFGEDHYGEVYAQGMDETAYSYKTLADFAWVARRIPPPLRNERLSFSHHKLVAPLEPDAQKQWLDYAAYGHFSVRELRRMIAEWQDDGSESEPLALPEPGEGNVITLPPLPLPPSINHYYLHMPKNQHKGSRIYTKEAREYLDAVRAIVEPLALELVMRPIKVSVDIHRARASGDLDNFIKPQLDALEGLVYINDSQVIELHMRRFDDKANPRAEVTITEMKS